MGCPGSRKVNDDFVNVVRRSDNIRNDGKVHIYNASFGGVPWPMVVVDVERNGFVSVEKLREITCGMWKQALPKNNDGSRAWNDSVLTDDELRSMLCIAIQTISNVTDTERINLGPLSIISAHRNTQTYPRREYTGKENLMEVVDHNFHHRSTTNGEYHSATFANSTSTMKSSWLWAWPPFQSMYAIYHPRWSGI